MDWTKHITINPEILVGKPIIQGTRISVELIIDLLANGWSEDQILSEYPILKKDDIRAALHYATHILKIEKVYPLPTGT